MERGKRFERLNSPSCPSLRRREADLARKGVAYEEGRRGGQKTLSYLPLRKGEANTKKGSSLRRGAKAPLSFFFPLSARGEGDKRG
jgi:hypothetical protein